MATKTWMYRHDEILTGRPFGFDVDEEGWLWEGCGRDRLTGHNLRTAACVQIPVPQMGQRPVYQAIAWEGKLVLTLGDAPFYLVFDPAKRTCVRREIPAARPIVWYGKKASNGKVILFERTESKVLVLDGPNAEPRPVACPFEGQLADGWSQSDGYLYCPLSDPARVVRFDPVKERFIDENRSPFAEATLAGSHEQDEILYLWDTAGGRLLPLAFEKGTWLDPIPAPDHGRVYGFMGGGFSFQGRVYICLSTFAHPSRLDLETGTCVVPEGPLTVDGRPPRFLDRLLVFDPRMQSFDYLVAPEQPDGIPLLCYSWTDGERFAITGIVIPFAEPGEPGRIFGPWFVLQSEPAKAEPGFELPDVAFDREAHLARYRRGYGAPRSLYLPHEAHSPAIINMQGPATDYPPGREAEIVRRAKKTDTNAYLSHLAEVVTRDAGTDAEAVKRVAGYVHQALYYNPIQIPHTSDPVAILESHDARCGQGVAVTLALLKALGIPARRVPLSHHVVAEATYDGGDHIVDAMFFGADQPHRDGRVLSVEALKADPYFGDAFPQACFAYDPELLESTDGFWVLGYVFGIWGSEPYYSYYLGAEKEHPPMLPLALPARRVDGHRVCLNWARSLKMGGGAVEYDVCVYSDRACTEAVFHVTTEETSVVYEVEEPNRMYFVEERAMDGHREKNPDTWYPAARSNFVLVPEDQYGWYGVV